eukprot:8673055-Lingulodinium_polyedra.AAC.1
MAPLVKPVAGSVVWSTAASATASSSLSSRLQASRDGAESLEQPRLCRRGGPKGCALLPRRRA